MPIRFGCQQCDARIKVPDGTEGRRVKCPRCAQLQTVPEESDNDSIGADASGQSHAGAPLSEAGGNSSGNDFQPPKAHRNDSSNVFGESLGDALTAASNPQQSSKHGAPGSSGSSSAPAAAVAAPPSRPKPLKMQSTSSRESTKSPSRSAEPGSVTTDTPPPPDPRGLTHRVRLGQAPYPQLGLCIWLMRIAAIGSMLVTVKVMLQLQSPDMTLVESILVLLGGLVVAGALWTLGEIAAAVRAIAQRQHKT